MKKIVCLFVCLFVGAANATPMTSSAEFDAGSTLIDFDTLATGIAVNNQYSGLGLTISGTAGNDGTGASTTVVTSSWDPIYIGNLSNAWDGSVIFDFSFGISQFGLELIDALPSYISVYDSANNLIESLTTTISGDNVFTGIDTGSTLFTRAIVSGSFYAVDDVQFSAASVPEPATFALLGLGLAGIGFSRKKKTA